LDEYEQYALYGEVNFELTSKVEATLGLRWYDETVDNVSLVPNSILGDVFPPRIAQTNDSGVVPKLNVTYHVSDDHLIYATAARGYRSSVINNNVTFGAGDEGATSDKLWNYEVGLKTDWADHRFAFNATAYYVDWSDIQIVLNQLAGLPGLEGTGIIFAFVENGGDARVQGLELETRFKATASIELGATASFVDSEVTRGERDVITGARLPNTPELTASAFARYGWAISTGLDGIVQIDAQHIGEQSTLPITTTLADPEGFPVDGYTIGNLRIGLQKDRWGIDFFVQNVGDVRAELGRGLPQSGSNLDPDRYTIIRPRTFGIAARASF
jgi:outer membrane receptor protein involved in Fe transport